MLLLELLKRDIGRWDVTIVATDIDAKALQRARKGIFSINEVEGVPSTWRNKYFVSHNNSFSVKLGVRRLVTFEAHNLVGDPPYRNMDLVICRNVLIYFTPMLQARVLKSFHDGLREGGFLLLGKAEVPVGETRGLFHCLDKEAKLYQKKGQTGNLGGDGVGCVTHYVSARSYHE